MITLKSLTLFFGLLCFLHFAFYTPRYNKSNAIQTNKAALYWFDATTHVFLIYDESTLCDNSSNYPCALGYSKVSDPSNPQKPNTIPDAIETGAMP